MSVLEEIPYSILDKKLFKKFTKKTDFFCVFCFLPPKLYVIQKITFLNNYNEFFRD